MTLHPKAPSGTITIDRAMAMLPGLRKERNQAVGVDFSVIHTTRGLQMLNIKEQTLRRAFLPRPQHHERRRLWRPCRLHDHYGDRAGGKPSRMNPDFFKGTAIETEAAAVLKADKV